MVILLLNKEQSEFIDILNKYIKINNLYDNDSNIIKICNINNSNEYIDFNKFIIENSDQCIIFLGKFDLNFNIEKYNNIFVIIFTEKIIINDQLLQLINDIEKPKENNCKKYIYFINSYFDTYSKTLNQIIEKINNITIKLNSEKNDRDKLREERKKLVKIILPFIPNDKEYFIIPYVRPYIYVSKDISIVGNSKKILRNKNGNIIDESNNVFRINYSDITGFEQYCGSKSDIRLAVINCIDGKPYPTHPKGLISNYKLYKNLKEKKYIIITKKIFNEEKLRKIATINDTNRSDKKYFNIVWNILIFNEIIKDLKLKLIKRPQAGTGIILLIRELGIVPKIFGFDLKLCKDNYGYFWTGNRIHKKLSPSHNISVEHKILNSLIKSKDIVNY